MEIKDTCCFCGTCVDVCPRNALELLDTGKVDVDPSACMEYRCRRWKCSLCAMICPVGAILIR
ncbi:MAG: 4Fe-4S binding protein [Candidatus Hydrothermarchaeales archaeon]